MPACRWCRSGSRCWRRFDSPDSRGSSTRFCWRRASRFTTPSWGGSRRGCWSSGFAHAPEQLGGGLDSGFGLGPVRRLTGVVVTEHVAAGELLHDDAIAPRQDLHALVPHAVGRLRLRNQPCNLAAHGNDGLVVPQRSCTVAGGVDDGLLRDAAEL